MRARAVRTSTALGWPTGNAPAPRGPRPRVTTSTPRPQSTWRVLLPRPLRCERSALLLSYRWLVGMTGIEPALRPVKSRMQSQRLLHAHGPRSGCRTQYLLRIREAPYPSGPARVVDVERIELPTFSVSCCCAPAAPHVHLSLDLTRASVESSWCPPSDSLPRRRQRLTLAHQHKMWELPFHGNRF
jgi:hypothetical protein